MMPWFSNQPPTARADTAQSKASRVKLYSGLTLCKTTEEQGCTADRRYAMGVPGRRAKAEQRADEHAYSEIPPLRV
jgi:hypothetical protein